MKFNHNILPSDKVALGGMAMAAAMAATAGNKPNIIYLMADDNQAFTLGCYGNKVVKTPNIDELARRGLVFDRCYSTSPICMPARATVMTGMYEFKTGCNFNTGGVSSNTWDKSYPAILKKNGYYLGFAGKWGIKVSGKYKYADTFDMWGGFDGHGQGRYETGQNTSLKQYAAKHPHVTGALAAFAVDFIDKAMKSKKPFCLSISFKAPHKPHRYVMSETKKLYDGVTFPTRANYGKKFGMNLATQARLGRQYAQWPEWAPNRYQDHMKIYCQLISGIDIAVGIIWNKLKKEGLDKNTVLIYTSDNGYALGSHGFQGKTLPYEEMARIPLIIVDPKSGCVGKRTKALAANIDMAPTILDFAGVSPLGNMDGKSLKPLLKDQKAKIHGNILLIQNWGSGKCSWNKGATIVADKWKYIFWCYGDKNLEPAEELYNIDSDPFETKNLVKTNATPEILSRLRQLYDAKIGYWKGNCVDYYKPFAKLFDRKVPWKEKHFVGPVKKFSTAKLYREVVGKDCPYSKTSRKKKR